MSTRGHLEGLALLLLGSVLGLGHAQNATSWIEVLKHKALTSGYQATLPPHVSGVLGLTSKGESIPVKQLVSRAAQKVRTFNVSDSNHRDVVLFLVDERAQSTVAYLLTPNGKLRKAISYPTGGAPRELTASDARQGLAREVRYWSDYAVGSQAAPAPAAAPGSPAQPPSAPNPATAPKPDEAPEPASGATP